MADSHIVALYSDLQKAKEGLKLIYNTTPNYTYYSYEINVHILIDNEYVATNESYLYEFDQFQFKGANSLT